RQITGAAEPAILTELALRHNIAGTYILFPSTSASIFGLFMEIEILLPEGRIGGVFPGRSSGHEVRDLPARKGRSGMEIYIGCRRIGINGQPRGPHVTPAAIAVVSKLYRKLSPGKPGLEMGSRRGGQPI